MLGRDRLPTMEIFRGQAGRCLLLGCYAKMVHRLLGLEAALEWCQHKEATPRACFAQSVASEEVLWFSPGLFRFESRFLERLEDEMEAVPEAGTGVPE